MQDGLLLDGAGPPLATQADEATRHTTPGAQEPAGAPSRTVGVRAPGVLTLQLFPSHLCLLPGDGLPCGGVLPLADIAGVSVHAGGRDRISSDIIGMTVAYAPYSPADHREYKRGPIGDSPGCDRHRRLAPLELKVSAASGETEVAEFAAAVRGAIILGANQPREEVARAPLLVLLNPASGSGAAAELYDSQAAPLFRAAGVATEVVETTSAGHAADLIGRLELGRYSGLVVVSGDGLVSEAVNGLMRRADWAAAIKTPIGHIPGGSGNGLATSILKACGEEYGVVEAAFVIARGRTQPLDLATCEGQPATAGYGGADAPPGAITSFYSFLSLSWAIVADIDIESETYRSCCGPSRFDISTVQRILCLRRYRGRLSYLPAANTSAVGEPGAAEVAATAAATDSTHTSPVVLKRHLPPALQTAVGERFAAVGEGWVVGEEGETILFWACNTAWASFGGEQTPGARLSDGCWQMLTISGNNPRLSFCEVLSIADNPASRANEHPNIRCVPVKAFRLEPETCRGCLGLPCLSGPKVGHVAIDGEDVALGAWQVEVHQGLATVIGA
jgi:hypothetical protein